MSGQEVCLSCGPGYRYGDDGCSHTPPAPVNGQVEALARVIWDAEGDGFAQMEWARKYAAAVLASDWLRDHDRALRKSITAEAAQFCSRSGGCIP